MRSSMISSSWTPWIATGCLALQFVLSPSFVLQAQAREWHNWRPYQQQASVPVPPVPTNAPVQQQPLSVQIPAGTLIPSAYTNAARIVLSPTETMPITLTVKQNLVGWNNQILIPANSQIEGQLQPVQGGTQFVAKDLILAGTNQPIPLNATSKVITHQETIRKGTNVSAILAGAAIGAAASSAIDLIVGDGKVGIGTILLGAAIGAGAGWWTKGQRYATVLVVDSQNDLDLTLNGGIFVPQPLTR